MSAPCYHIVLAAGGTGGHMMPADVLAAELKSRGHKVSFITDQRGAALPGFFLDGETMTLMTRNRQGLIGRLKFYAGLVSGFFSAKRFLKQQQPDLVIGFGGYPSAPAVMAAHSLNIPTMIHEQNAILGRTNRLVAAKAKLIALTFSGTERLPAGVPSEVTGLPVRSEIAAIAPFQQSDLAKGISILVVGGSQGARILSDIVPAAIGEIPKDILGLITVTHQARPEDVERVKAIYTSSSVKADVDSYFTDLPQRISKSALIIARAGASTLAEITVAGRASILVPLTTAMDDHQTANARHVPVGACFVLSEQDFTVENLLERLTSWLNDPIELVKAGAIARSAGRSDATQSLGDAVENLVLSQQKKEDAK